MLDVNCVCAERKKRANVMETSQTEARNAALFCMYRTDKLNNFDGSEHRKMFSISYWCCCFSLGDVFHCLIFRLCVYPTIESKYCQLRLALAAHIHTYSLSCIYPANRRVNCTYSFLLLLLFSIDVFNIVRAKSEKSTRRKMERKQMFFVDLYIFFSLFFPLVHSPHWR